MDTQNIQMGKATTVRVTGTKEGDGTWRGSGSIDKPSWADVAAWSRETFGVEIPADVLQLPLQSLALALTKPPSGQASYRLALTLAFTLGEVSATVVIGIDHGVGTGFTAGATLFLPDKGDDAYAFTGTLQAGKALTFTLEWATAEDGIPVTDLAHALGLDVDPDVFPAAAVTGARLYYTAGGPQTPYSLAATFSAGGVRVAAALTG
ncbi:hypothetical protein ABT097_10185 [Streptomyces sp. NPDC002225]|uniref:hypothetical protein n=1 Tax=Streptomyces sp. NPDC002225 TaxID=3154413 RepID=UPI00332B2C5D